MKNLSQKTKLFLKTKSILKNGNYFIDVQTTFPERVPESALEVSADSAKQYLDSLDDQDLLNEITELILENGEDVNVSTVLTNIADRNDDCGVYETITPVIKIKN